MPRTSWLPLDLLAHLARLHAGQVADDLFGLGDGINGEMGDGFARAIAADAPGGGNAVKRGVGIDK